MAVICNFACDVFGKGKCLHIVKYFVNFASIVFLIYGNDICHIV